MTNRILDFSESGAYLSLKDCQLVIRRDGVEKTMTTPVAEIAALILSNPAISLTLPLMAALAEAGAVIVVCGANRLPVSLLAPLVGHSVQGEIMTRQAAAPLPLRKRLWKTVAQSKIRSQASFLEERTGGDAGLRAIAARVRSGDPDNCEAHAARVYWPLVFADPDFRRDPDAGGANRFLNYGYAVLRAIAARALCASGLHPSLGVHHHNRYDAFCLADDLMEPFRPLVDRAVADGLPEWGPDAEMNRDVKRGLLGALTSRVEFNGESRTLFNALSGASASLAGVFSTGAGELRLPSWKKARTEGGEQEIAEADAEDLPADPGMRAMTVSAYQAMWLIVLFDLPVETSVLRKEYARFRKVLLKDGFAMLQYSVYARFCASEDAAKVHRAIVRETVPPHGQVRILACTDRQFGKMEVYFGKIREKPEEPMLQLELF